MIIITNNDDFSFKIDLDGELIYIQGHNHFSLIRSLLRKFSQALFVSPFLYDDFGSLFDGVIQKNHTIELITTCSPRGHDQFKKPYSLNSFATDLKKNTGEWPVINIDQKLHSKIYIFYKGGSPIIGLVTSANLTCSGLNHNNETGIIVKDVKVLAELEQSARNNLDYINISEYQLGLMLSAVSTVREMRKFEDEDDEEIGLSNILNNNCTPSHGNTRIKLKDNARYYIKVSGEKDFPIYPEDEEKFNDPHAALTFSKAPGSIAQGDCLLEVAVGGACFLSYYCCASGIFERTSIEKKSNPAHKRWPFYMYCNNLSIAYGESWFKEPLYYDSLIAEFLENNPNADVTPSGAKHIVGAIQFGNSYFEVTKEFGQFVRAKIDNHFASQGIQRALLT
ncbi:restriction endonuclease PLD domain-containing protein [Aquitalea denitrificans]|uniref:restriction endonuclease PLD domain-containing protein n=1 Tax=Aquitalea denitrificans TaxID=519081 RepID=UPI00135A19E9|nr:restriction endonuclease PLD domain-containing protein [Aquitalea denitrificans]